MQATYPEVVLWSLPAEQRHDRPLLVVMHGYGADEADLFGLVPYLPSDPVIASIRAPYQGGPGFAWFPVNPEHPGVPDESEADAAVRAVIGWLDSLPAAPSVGLLGFSQGGAMTMQLMRYEPRRFSFGVVLSGYLVGEEQPGDSELALIRPPVFWGRGEEDPAFSGPLIDRTAAWLSGHSTLEQHLYQGLGHAISEQELSDINQFIEAQL